MSIILGSVAPASKQPRPARAQAVGFGRVVERSGA